MSDIPSFEPNWKLDDPNIIGQNAEAFVTIEETLARIKLIKEVGLANLYEKGVLIKDPYASVYDMVSAIKNIPVSSGWPRQIPKINTGLKIEKVSSSLKCWVTSFPTVLKTSSDVKILSLSDIFQSQANPYFVSWASAEAGEEKDISIQTLQGDSVFCFVWYSISSTDESSLLPFSLSEGWTLQKISESLVIDDKSYRVAYYIKNDKAATQESITISNNGLRRINCCLIDFWNYQSTPEFLIEYSGTGTQVINKEFDEPYVWVMRSFENDGYSYIMRPDDIRKNRIFNNNIKQNLMFLDRNEKGERQVSFDGTKTYSFFSLRLN